MIVPTKEDIITIVSGQGFHHNSSEGQDLYNNLLALTTGDWTGPQVRDFLMNLREMIFPGLNVLKILEQLEIL